MSASRTAKWLVGQRNALGGFGSTQDTIVGLHGLTTFSTSPSPGVLKRLHGVLFQRSKAEERVMPAEVKMLGWRKGERSGMVVRGAGGPGRGSKAGGSAVRVGGRVPWGAKAEFAYRAGYDGRGRVSVTHVVERGYSAMLTLPELRAA